MNINKKVLIITIIVLIITFFGFAIVYAHPGKTDKNGGHVCRTNCAKWGLKKGEYHYHKKKVKKLNLKDALIFPPHILASAFLSWKE